MIASAIARPESASPVAGSRRAAATARKVAPIVTAASSSARPPSSRRCPRHRGEREGREREQCGAEPQQCVAHSVRAHFPTGAGPCCFRDRRFHSAGGCDRRTQRGAALLVVGRRNLPPGRDRGELAISRSHPFEQDAKLGGRRAAELETTSSAIPFAAGARSARRAAVVDLVAHLHPLGFLPLRCSTRLGRDGCRRSQRRSMRPVAAAAAKPISPVMRSTVVGDVASSRGPAATTESAAVMPTAP